jgi:26S proteasome regulatory subunit N9
VLLLANLARAKLLYGDVEGTKKDMDKAGKILDEELTGSGAEPAVNAAYYSIAADYYKVRLHVFIGVAQTG